MTTKPATWSDYDLDQALAELLAATEVTEQALPALRVRVFAAADQAAPGTGINAGRARAPTASAARHRRRSPVRLAACAAAITVAAAGIAVVSTTPFGHRPAGASAAAAEVLNTAANALAAHSSDLNVSPGQFLLRTEHEWQANFGTGFGPPIAYLSEERRRTWIPADPHGTWLRRDTDTGRYKFLAGTPQQARAAGLLANDPHSETRRARCGDFDVPAGQVCAAGGTWQNPTGPWLAQLPRNPDALYRRVKADAPRVGPGGAELFTYLTDALRTGLVPADLRAACYEVMARLPGLTITERAANLDGRHGIALGISDGTEVNEIIINPVTGTFVGERSRTTEASTSDGLPAGATLSFTAVEQRVVDHIGRMH